MGGLIVVYDACVLYPAPLRDLLLQLATSGVFQAKWSDTIHDQWTNNVLEHRPVDSLVSGFEPLIGTVHPGIDPKDRHVVAAAIHGQASVIVTFNLVDFPVEALKSHDMEAQHPDEFLMHLEACTPGILAQAAKIVRARLRNPPVAPADYIDIILRQRLPATAASLRALEALI